MQAQATTDSTAAAAMTSCTVKPEMIPFTAMTETILSMAALFISVNALLQSIGLRLEFTVLLDVTVYTLLNLYLTSRIPADAEFKIAMTEQHYAALSKRRRRFFFF